MDVVAVPVAFAQNTRDELRLQNGDGQIAGALAAEPGMKQTTYVAQVQWASGGGKVHNPTLPSQGDGSGNQVPCVAFSAGNSADSRSIGLSENHTPPLRAGASGTNMTPTIMTAMQVRRLTPTECERLQGFPDSWTSGFSDSTRYKMLGNAVCVNVAEWIARRLVAVAVEEVCHVS